MRRISRSRSWRRRSIVRDARADLTASRHAVARAASRPSGIRNATPPVAAFCASSVRSAWPPGQQGVPDRQRDAVLEPDVGADRVDEPVDPRDAVGVGAADTGQPQHGPLDRHGGVGAGQRDDGPPRLPGEGARLAHDRRVERELARVAGRCSRSVRSFVSGEVILRGEDRSTPDDGARRRSAAVVRDRGRAGRGPVGVPDGERRRARRPSGRRRRRAPAAGPAAAGVRGEGGARVHPGRARCRWCTAARTAPHGSSGVTGESEPSASDDAGGRHRGERVERDGPLAPRAARRTSPARRPRARRRPAAPTRRRRGRPGSRSSRRRPSRRARAGAGRRARRRRRPARRPRGSRPSTASSAPSPMAWKPACRPACGAGDDVVAHLRRGEVGVPRRGRRRRRPRAGRRCASRSRRRRTGRRPHRSRPARGPLDAAELAPVADHVRAGLARGQREHGPEVLLAGDVRPAQLVQAADAQRRGARAGWPAARPGAARASPTRGPPAVRRGAPRS